MPNRLALAFHASRVLGLGWVRSRIQNAVELRLGLLERRLPRHPWRTWTAAEALSATEAWRHNRGTFFFAHPDRVSWADRLQAFDLTERGPYDEAEAVAAGRFRYFSCHEHSLGVPPDWFLDPWTGRRRPSEDHWAHVEDVAGQDIKILWEPSRFSWVYPLVRAHWRTGDPRYAEAFWRWLESWRLANPPNTGPNWRCGQETSFRVLAWVVGLWGFESAPATSNERAAALLEMLEESGRRIAGHINYALSQKNNHGVSEAVGLFTLGTLFPGWSQSAAWEARGRALLDQLATELVYEDGAFSQHSFNYQRVVLDEYSWALSLARLAGRPLAPLTRDRIAQSARLLAAWINPVDGAPPNHGPNDGARVLPLDNRPFTDYRGSAQLASLAAGGPRLFPEGPWDESSLWILGTESPTVGFEPVPEGSLDAPIGGYHGWRRGDTSVFLHVPQFRHRPAHADLLHCDVVWRGLRLSRDAGTFSYNAPAPWENGLASTRYHGTVEVDGVSQMDRVARFIWVPWPQCRMTGRGSDPANGCEWIDATHDGYARLPDPVTHQRRVVLVGSMAVVVFDRILGRRPHLARLHWLLPDLPAQSGPQPGQFELQRESGRVAVCVGTRDGGGHGGLHRGSPGDARGWESRYYLRLDPALSLEWTTTAAVTTFWTVFSDAGLRVTARPDGLVIQDVHGRKQTLSWPGESATSGPGDPLC
jgi:hypothetical protein